MIVFIFQINIFRKKSKHDLSGKRLKSEKLEWDRNQAKYSLIKGKKFIQYINVNLL